MSSRKLIAQGLVAWLQTVQNTDTSTALYQYVKNGAIWDPSAYTGLWAEVTYAHGKSGPAGSGGHDIGWRIQDKAVWSIGTGYRYDADSTTCMNSIYTAMDMLLPAIHSHYKIPNPNNPLQPIGSVYSVLVGDQNDKGQPVTFPNGYVYFMWNTYVTVMQQYGVDLVSP
jgi:hypothetical protein